jgi:hypothetical protein
MILSLGNVCTIPGCKKAIDKKTKLAVDSKVLGMMLDFELTGRFGSGVRKLV